MKRKPKASKSIRNAKRAVKQTAKQARQIKRTAKATKTAFKKVSKSWTKSLKARSDARELSQIERLLGEEFDTLAQARRELKKQSKPTKPSKKKSTKVPPKSQAKSTPKVMRITGLVKIKDIPGFKGKSWARILKDDKLLASLDARKKPSEYFIGSVFGNQTHKFFRTGAEVVEQLNSYIGSYIGDESKMIDTFSIGTLEGREPSEYAREVDARIKENKERALQERRDFGDIFGKTTEQGKTKTFRDYAKDAAKLADETRKEKAISDARLSAVEKLLKKQTALINKLLKQASKPAKKATKKVAKKATKKVAKKAVKSSTKKVSKKNASKRSTKPVRANGAAKAKGSSTKSVSPKRSAKPSTKRGGKTQSKSVSRKSSKPVSQAKPKTATRKQPVKKAVKPKRKK